MRPIAADEIPSLTRGNSKASVFVREFLDSGNEAVVVEDDLGRSTEIECKRFAKYQFEVDPMIVLNEAGITVKMVGEDGNGWCEFCWNRGYLDFARKHIGEFQPYPDMIVEPA